MKNKNRFVGLVSIMLFFVATAQSQMVAVPDVNFKNKLLSLGYASCFNSMQDSIDASCSLVVNTTSLNLQSSSIASLQGIQAFTNLSSLDCMFNQLTSLPALPANLMGLYCSNNQLMSLPALPNTITNFFCENNQLTSLPALPSSLLGFICRNNQLTSLPTLPALLQEFYCENNLLTSMPTLPNSILQMKCFNNLLTSFPNLPTSMTFLDCHTNQLNSLPTLPSGLINLYCNDNNLTSLPALPSSLSYLNVGDNLLTNLPTLNNGLSSLICETNQLVSLPTLPNSLTTLLCSNNQLSALPALPNTIQMLLCNNNLLTTMPSLPNNLSTFHCQNNLISSLPPINSSMNILFIFNNNISCIPNIPPSVTLINLDSADIHCIPNFTNAQIFDGAGGQAFTMPLCGLNSITPCPLAWNIYGTVFFDSNLNCTKDANENKMADMKVFLYDNNNNLLQQTITNSSGEYLFDVNNYGTYKIQLDTVQYGNTASCANFQQLTSTITALDSLDMNMDFGIKCSGTFNEKKSYGTYFISGNFFPADTAIVNPIMGQYGFCNGNIGGTVTLEILNHAKFATVLPTSLTPSYFSTDSLVWTISNFNTIDFYNDFKTKVVTDSFVMIGNQVCFKLTIKTSTPDLDTTNNIAFSCYNVFNSFDPNDKNVQPSGNILPSNEWLTYTIRFQNTGNAAARNIVIKDTLDTNLQFQTFELISYSHKPNIDITASGVVKFSFPSINLPDSTSNEEGSHGYVTYRIKQKPNLPIGTIIKNTAAIYFDFNSPIITNTTNSLVNYPTLVNERQAIKTSLFIYPNPTNQLVTIQLKNSILNGQIKICDVLGNTIYQTKSSPKTNSLTIDVSAFSNGIYLIQYTNENGEKMQSKFIKN